MASKYCDRLDCFIQSPHQHSGTGPAEEPREAPSDESWAERIVANMTRAARDADETDSEDEVRGISIIACETILDDIRALRTALASARAARSPSSESRP